MCQISTSHLNYFSRKIDFKLGTFFSGPPGMLVPEPNEEPWWSGGCRIGGLAFIVEKQRIRETLDYMARQDEETIPPLKKNVIDISRSEEAPSDFWRKGAENGNNISYIRQ